MTEQSHKAEMSSLVKADFERLRARGVTATILAPDTQAPVVHEPRTAAEVASPSEEGSVEVAAAGWLRRLLGSS